MASADSTQAKEKRMASSPEYPPNNQVSAPGRFRVAISLLLAVIMISAGSLYLFRSSAPPQPASEPAPVPVSTVRAEQYDVAHLSDAVGTVTSLQNVVVRSQVEGILAEVFFNEGDLVQSGQQLARIDDRALAATLATTQAQLTRDQAQLDVAEQDLKRYHALIEHNAVSRQVVDQQIALVEQLRAVTELDRASVELARVNLSYTRIYSPVTGRVGIRHVDAGNLVRTNDTAGIVTVTQVDPISVVFPVSGETLRALRAVQAQEGAVAAVDRFSGEILGHGKIAAFDNAIDASTGTSRVRAVFDNKAERLYPGDFVAVHISTGMTRNATVVPSVAVRPGLDGYFVYRIKDAAAERVPVRVGYSNDSIAVIVEGIAPGEAIVTDGHSRLKPGARVIEKPGQAQSSVVGFVAPSTGAR